VHLALVRTKKKNSFYFFNLFLFWGLQRQSVVSRRGLYDQPRATLHSKTVVCWGAVLFDGRSVWEQDRAVPRGAAWLLGCSLASHLLELPQVTHPAWVKREHMVHKGRSPLKSYCLWNTIRAVVQKRYEAGGNDSPVPSSCLWYVGVSLGGVNKRSVSHLPLCCAAAAPSCASPAGLKGRSGYHKAGSTREEALKKGQKARLESYNWWELGLCAFPTFPPACSQVLGGKASAFEGPQLWGGAAVPWAGQPSGGTLTLLLGLVAFIT